MKLHFRMLKNSNRGAVLKGHDFSRAEETDKIDPGFTGRGKTPFAYGNHELNARRG
jgi:hypothetical protein